MQLGLEDQEQAGGEDEAAEEAGSSDVERHIKQRAKPKRNRGHLPKHLPRIERIIGPEEKACPCCAGQMHVPRFFGARTRASSRASSRRSSR